MAAPQYLLSRTLDPIFGITVGVLSFYSYERRNQKAKGHSFNELVLKRFNEFKSSN